MFILVLSAFILSGIIIYLTLAHKKPQWLPALYTVNVSIDCFFSLKEKKAMLKSLTQWQKATHGLVTFHIVNMSANKLIYNSEYPESGFAINFVRTLSQDEDVKKWDKLFKRSLVGYAQGNEPCGLIFIVVDRLKNNTIFTATCAHEIGHLLGLPHSPDKSTLMYKYIHNTKPTQKDIKKLVLLWRDWIDNYYKTKKSPEAEPPGIIFKAKLLIYFISPP